MLRWGCACFGDETDVARLVLADGADLERRCAKVLKTEKQLGCSDVVQPLLESVVSQKTKKARTRGKVEQRKIWTTGLVRVAFPNIQHIESTGRPAHVPFHGPRVHGSASRQPPCH